MRSTWLRFGAVVALVSMMLAVGAPAQALQGPMPEPVRFPGSTLKRSAPDMTTKEWNRFLKQHPELRPARAGNWAKVGLRGAGTVSSALFGLEIGTHVAGVFGLSTSGDFWCDLARATVSSDCGLVPHPEYVPNSDIDVTAEGWIGHSTFYGDGWATAAGAVTWTYHPTQPRSILVSGFYEHVRGGRIEYEDGHRKRFGVRTVVECVAEDPTIPGRVDGFAQPINTSSSSWSGGKGSAWFGPAPGPVMPEPVYSVCPSGLTPDRIRLEGHSLFLTPLADFPAEAVYVPVGWYYPEGHPDRPGEQDPDPETWWRTTWRCDAAAPIVRESARFHETDAHWPSMPQAECDPGAVVTSILIEQMTGLGVRDTIVDWELDQAGIDWQEDHGHCVAGDCELLLWRIDPQTDKLLNCFQNPELCYDWFRAPNRANQYQCTYGGTVVDLRECYVYKRIFKDRVYVDPDPGDETDEEPDVGVPPLPDPEGPPRQDGDENCPPPFQWHSVMNPWWYYKSFVCSLQDMFIPKQGPKLQRVQDAINGTAIGQIGTLWGDPLGFGGQLFDPASMSCGVIVDEPVSVLQGQRIVVDTCEGIWQRAGGARTVIGVAFIAAGVLGGMWVLLGTVRIRAGGEAA